MALDIKKHKRKRVPVEESADIAPSVEEAKPERKKRRTESKKDEVEEDRRLRSRTDSERTPVQSETSAKHVHVSDHAPRGDHPKQKKMPKIIDADKVASSGKAEMRLPRKGRIGDEREMRQNSIETAEPNNDQATSNSSRRNDATVKNAQKTKKRKPSTDLHADRLAAPIDKDDLNAIAPLKRKRKHKSDDVTNATDMVGTTDHETPQPRKRKHSEKHSEPTQVEGSTPVLEKNTSRSSRQGIYPDPTKDTELTAPALKALSYVHTHISSPDSWKFSKARQNWVVRNLWDDNAIPDVYFPSCVKYVANIRGNTRDMLIKSSKSALDEVSENTASSDTVKPPVTVSQGAGEVESPEEQLRRRQMRVKRAEMISAALAEAKP